MAITRVGGVAGTINSTDLSLSWSTAGGGSNPQAGDFALLIWNGQSGLTWGGDSVGFALLDDVVADSGSHEGRVYYRVCDGINETGALDLTHSAINKQTALLEIHRGVDPAVPISAWAVRDETTAGTSHANPQVTTGTANEGIVTAIQERVTDSSTNYTAPSPGYTKRLQPTPVGGGGSTSAAVADDGFGVSRAAGTNVTPPNWTNGVSTANVLTWTIALRPAETSTPKAGSDSGALTEAAASLSVAAAGADSGTLTETASSDVASAAADSGTLAEAATRVTIGELDFRFAIDWNADGDFDGPGEDVTDRVLAKGGFSTSYGRDQARAYAPPATGRAGFSLSNTSGDYSPDRADSPLAGDLLPAREIDATVDLNGETHTLFRGHLDDYKVKVERNDWSVDATGLDPLAKLQGATISTPLYQGIRTGTAIGYLLDAVGWPAEKRTLDPGATLIRWWWATDEDAWTALMRLVSSEGPGALVHADESGGIVFRDRHHRLLSEASTTGQAVITDGTDGWEPAFSAITYDHGWGDIVNSVSFTVEELDPSDDFEEVWTSPDGRTIDPSATLTLDVQATSPVFPGSIFLTYAFSGSVTSTFTQNTAQSITVEFTAGPSGAFINDLIVHGQMVAARRSYTVEQSDPASIAKYGRRSPGSSIEAPWAGVHDALAIAELIVGARAERLPTVQITMKGARINDRLVEQVGRDLSDRIHITETVTGVDTDFFLEQISHRVLPGGFLETEFGLEKAATQVTNVVRFDDPDYGFDDGVFGSAGLDDPANLLLFDVEGRGFDDGVFAT